MKACVLVVDDEATIQDVLETALTAAGFETVTARNGWQALQLASIAAPDVILLDLGLPDLDGKTVISEIRHFARTPIIVLSGRDQEGEKIAALDLGADDYVQKPFVTGELMARIRAALRHGGQTGARPLTQFGTRGLFFDLPRRRIQGSGSEIKLTPKEFLLLSMLAANAGRIVTNRQILSAIWGPSRANDKQILRVLIGQLRAKIGEDAADPKIIVTEPGVGYRLRLDD